jgi:hypothetical protein
MAQVKISGATVVYTNPKGFTAKGQVKVLGEKGDVVELVGDLSVRIENYEDKRTGQEKQAAAIHVNNPIIKSDSPF